MAINLGNEKVHISGSNPKVKFEGSESGAKTLSIRENTGKIEIYDENTGTVVLTIEQHANRHTQGGADEVIGIVLQGLDADKPAAGTAGRFWLSTDTLSLYYDNGTAWILVGILAGLDLSAHASRHNKGGADAIPDDGLGYSQIKVSYGTEQSVTVTASSTSVIPEGRYIVRCGANTKVEYSPDGGTTWYDLVAVGGIAEISSDGTNCRFNNTGSADDNSYYLPIE